MMPRACARWLANRSIGGRSRAVVGTWPLQGYVLDPADPLQQRHVTPESYALPSIIFYLPELRFQARFPEVYPNAVMPCPCCGYPGHVTADGFAPPKLVVCYHQNMVMVCRNLCCHTCKESGRPYMFRGWDPKVTQQLPRFSQETVPFVATRRAAVSIECLHALNRWIMRSGTYSSFRDGLEIGRAHV